MPQAYMSIHHASEASLRALAKLEAVTLTEWNREGETYVSVKFTVDGVLIDIFGEHQPVE